MSRRQWTAHEIGLLSVRYPEKGLTGLAGMLDRSEDSITSMAKRLGLRSLNRHRNQVMSRLRAKRPSRQEEASSEGRHIYWDDR